MKSILNRSFRYTPSAETDLRKTFARIRREQKQTSEAERQEMESRITSIAPLLRGTERRR